jgi:predicted SprT family Zn-dependent metalloprotease
MNLSELEKFLPRNALPFVEIWLRGTHTVIKLKNARKTKLGDYLYLRDTNRHQITVDKQLLPEAFFFVLTHEIAHLLVRENEKKRTKPHGNEWKLTFGKILRESIEVYSPEIRAYILNHSQNPKANLASDAELWNFLFSKNENQAFKIEKLIQNQKFRIGKRVFEKKEKRKIRYICKEISTGKLYLINGQAIVDEIFNE